MNLNRLVLFLSPFLLVFQIGLADPAPSNIVNIHESVEKFNDVTKLQSTMGNLGMTDVVLHGIPKDLLKFNPEEGELDLHDSNANHDYIAQASEVYPENFSFFCTIEPTDPEWEDKLTDCVDEGSIGIKLYSGYSYAHPGDRLDDARYADYFKSISDYGLILMFPMNVSKYQDEFENILSVNPELTTVCPHYCLSSKSLDRLRSMLERFPNLYIDTSFGHEDFVRDGFTTITENRDEFLDLFDRFQDRILFATDNVVTTYEDKNEDFIEDLYSDYLSILTDAEFESALDGTEYHGLDLAYPVQRKVFWQNWTNLLE